MQGFVEIFHEGNFFCGNLPQRHFWWKLTRKATFCEYFQQGGSRFCDFSFLNKTEYFFLNVSMKTAQHMEGILRQNSVNFGEKFRKIHQTDKISTQQRCHAARVFVTLPQTPIGCRKVILLSKYIGKLFKKSNAIFCLCLKF